MVKARSATRIWVNACFFEGSTPRYLGECHSFLVTPARPVKLWPTVLCKMWRCGTVKGLKRGQPHGHSF